MAPITPAGRLPLNVWHPPPVTRELYISADVEPDGHVPATSSRVSLGACAAALRDGDGNVQPERHVDLLLGLLRWQDRGR